MNKITPPREMQTPEVTTGPIVGSHKVYSSPAGHDGPARAIPGNPAALRRLTSPPVRVYDTSGPYTDDSATIDVEKGLPRIREAWISSAAALKQYDGRDVKPEDNGNVSGKALAREFHHA
jgi:phosphomethylpyrimidine synthase